MREASIHSKKHGEKGISAKAIRRVTEVGVLDGAPFDDLIGSLIGALDYNAEIQRMSWTNRV